MMRASMILRPDPERPSTTIPGGAAALGAIPTEPATASRSCNTNGGGAAGPPLDEPGFFTVDELASFMRLNRKTVYEMIRQDRIPGVRRFKRSIRIYIPAVLEWAAADSRQRRR